MVLQHSPAMFLMCTLSIPLFQKGNRGGFPSHSTSPSANNQTSPLPSPKRRGILRLECTLILRQFFAELRWTDFVVI